LKSHVNGNGEKVGDDKLAISNDALNNDGGNGEGAATSAVIGGAQDAGVAHGNGNGASLAEDFRAAETVNVAKALPSTGASATNGADTSLPNIPKNHSPTSATTVADGGPVGVEDDHTTGGSMEEDGGTKTPDDRMNDSVTATSATSTKPSVTAIMVGAPSVAVAGSDANF